jgi:hypothetical protein
LVVHAKLAHVRSDPFGIKLSSRRQEPFPAGYTPFDLLEHLKSRLAVRKGFLTARDSLLNLF